MCASLPVQLVAVLTSSWLFQQRAEAKRQCVPKYLLNNSGTIHSEEGGGVERNNNSNNLCS